MKETKLTEKKIYSYIEKNDHSIREYNFWKTPYDTWKIMKTIYDSSGDTETKEIVLPIELLNKILTDTAKENLTNE